MNMNAYGLLVQLVVVASLLAACSSNDTSSPDANFTLSARIDNVSSGSVSTKGPATAGDVADSVIVSRVRVLVRRIVLHPAGMQDSSSDPVVKSGPFVLMADSTSNRVIASVHLASGSYDKLKFEMHRFSSSEVPMYRNDTTFSDFVSDDRYSVIIDGYVLRKGVMSAFVYRSDVTSNVTLSSTTVEIPSTGMYVAALVFSTASAFRGANGFLDPADPKNESQIDNNIRSAFRLSP